VAALKAGGKKWAKELKFDEGLADAVLGWMRDVRQFAPSDLGFDWLMRLVARSESRYHDFAVEVMSKAFVPADFAPAPESSAAPQPQAAAGKSAAPPTVDLKGASFVLPASWRR
jgi:hypothetical protein